MVYVLITIKLCVIKWEGSVFYFCLILMCCCMDVVDGGVHVCVGKGEACVKSM